jgi:hypothetical protein
MEELLQPHAGELRRVVLRRPVELTGDLWTQMEQPPWAILQTLACRL